MTQPPNPLADPEANPDSAAVPAPEPPGATPPLPAPNARRLERLRAKVEESARDRRALSVLQCVGFLFWFFLPGLGAAPLIFFASTGSVGQRNLARVLAFANLVWMLIWLAVLAAAVFVGWFFWTLLSGLAPVR